MCDVDVFVCVCFVCFVIHIIIYKSLSSWTINQWLLMVVDVNNLVFARNLSVMLFFSMT
jgi:hypothetical protein